jgi:hypothetical protein
MALKDYMTEQGVDFQLVPPHVHCRNAAERAIHTFKNHLIVGLCSTDKDFPLHLWDRLPPQAILTLNLMRGSRINPKLSAWAQVNGNYDFNRIPIAPPGIRVLVYETPTARASWSPHAVDGWYVGPAQDSYRIYRVWIEETRAECNADMLAWFPTKVTMPIASSVDTIIAGAKDIVHALEHPSTGFPLAPLSDSEAATLRTLTGILINRSEPKLGTSPTTVSFAPEVEPAPPPRVPPINQAVTAPSQRVPSNDSPTYSPSKNAPVPRVASTPSQPMYANSTSNRFCRRRLQRKQAKQAQRPRAKPMPHIPRILPQQAQQSARATANSQRTFVMTDEMVAPTPDRKASLSPLPRVPTKQP